MASKEAEKYVEELIAEYSDYHKHDDELTALTSAYWENIPVKLDDIMNAFDAGVKSAKDNNSQERYKSHGCPDCPAFGKYCPHKVDKSKYDLPREENLYLLDKECGIYSCQLTVDELMKKMERCK